MAGQGNGFFGNAFHQAAVAVDDIGIMRAEFIAESGVDNPFGQRHADRRGNSLPQRTRRHVNSGQMPVFRMSGRLGTELAKIAQVININIFIAEQIQQRIKQHGTVTGRKDKAVTVKPARFCRIDFDEL